jgi:hypothetical protein
MSRTVLTDAHPARDITPDIPPENNVLHGARTPAARTLPRTLPSPPPRSDNNVSQRRHQIL